MIWIDSSILAKASLGHMTSSRAGFAEPHYYVVQPLAPGEGPRLRDLVSRASSCAECATVD